MLALLYLPFCYCTIRCFVIFLTEDVQFFIIKMGEDRIAVIKTFLAGVLRCQDTLTEATICRSFTDEIMLR